MTIRIYPAGNNPKLEAPAVNVGAPFEPDYPVIFVEAKELGIDDDVPGTKLAVFQSSAGSITLFLEDSNGKKLGAIYVQGFEGVDIEVNK